MEDTIYGKAALAKLAPAPKNFRLYEAGWLGNKPSEWNVMEVKGMEFREAKSGPNKGQLTMPIAGTKRTVYVTKEEMGTPTQVLNPEKSKIEVHSMWETTALLFSKTVRNATHCLHHITGKQSALSVYGTAGYGNHYDDHLQRIDAAISHLQKARELFIEAEMLRNKFCTLAKD